MFRLLLWAAICSVCFCHSPIAKAHPPVTVYSIPAASFQASYHRRVQYVDAQIRLQEAQIASIERMLAEWEPLDRFRNSRVMGLDIERMQLELAEAKFGLECLKQQKFDLVRSRARGW